MLKYTDLIEYMFTPTPIYWLVQSRNILFYLYDTSGFGAKLDITPAIESYGNNIFKACILSYTWYVCIQWAIFYYCSYFHSRLWIFIHNGCSSGIDKYIFQLILYTYFVKITLHKILHMRQHIYSHLRWKHNLFDLIKLWSFYINIFILVFTFSLLY